MILAVVACWLAVGLLIFADPARTRKLLAGTIAGRALALRHYSKTQGRVMRTVGFGLLALSVTPFVRALGLGLGVVAFVLAAMTATSIAALFAPWKPRLYAVSVLGAAILTGVFVAFT